MPRFVILEHHHQGVHWDFMLESADSLRTWRLERPPAGADATITATPLPDHRLDYLDYEGEVSGGRGTVSRWDRGDFEWIVDQPLVIEVRLVGQRVRGCAYLGADESGRWSFLLASVEPDRNDSATR